MERLVVVSPVRNEAAHIERLVASMAAQTRPPDAWIVVDDASDDGTLELLMELEQGIPFMTVSTAPQRPAASDRLAAAAAPCVFNAGLSAAPEDGFDFVGKLDGDIELPEDYFERLLERFRADPQLGIAGGDLIEPDGSGWKRVPIPDQHVPGALKLYSRECYDAIGGVHETLGWDTIDETYARLRGFRTASFRDLVVRHHRPCGSADGQLRGRARHGACAYIAHQGPLWVLGRAFKLTLSRPYVIAGPGFLYGYLRAALRRTPRVQDDEFRAFTRRELRKRMWRGLRPRASY